MGMKLSRHAFVRFWDVHAWSGVVGGLVLHLMFLTGSITLFHEQLATWEEPLAQRASVPDAPLHEILERGIASVGPTQGSLWLRPPRSGHATAELDYQPPGSEWQEAWIDLERGAVPKRERLSSFVYSLHFLWHDATGNFLYYTAGGLAIAFLLALATGVLIHLKDFVQKFGEFRPEKSRRVLWSDMHKVLGVMGLPFQVMYAYTGAFIVFAPPLLDAFAGPIFDGDRRRAEEVAFQSPAPAPALPGAKANSLELQVLLARARSALPGFDPEFVNLHHHGHENGTADFWGKTRGAPEGHAVVRLRAVDGAVLWMTPRTEEANAVTRRWIEGLHFAHFGSQPLRFLFFALGLATCATILTGNFVWLARRESRRTSASNRFLSRLTVGIGAGSVVAIAALFLTSRLLPLEWSARGTAEELTFLAVLCGCIAWAFAAREEGALWWRYLALAGLLLLPVPLLSARWSDAGLFGVGARLGAVVGVDLALLLTAFALLGCAALVRRT